MTAPAGKQEPDLSQPGRLRDHSAYICSLKDETVRRFFSGRQFVNAEVDPVDLVGAELDVNFDAQLFMLHIVYLLVVVDTFLEVFRINQVLSGLDGFLKLQSQFGNLALKGRDVVTQSFFNVF